jgi:hypothetical protein
MIAYFSRRPRLSRSPDLIQRRSIAALTQQLFGAYRIIEDAGGIDQLIESCLPDGTERRTHRNLAGRGDLVTHLDAKGRTAAGIVANGCAVFPGPEKLTFLKIRDCNLRAWRIG